jgi:hypothetical protein
MNSCVLSSVAPTQANTCPSGETATAGHVSVGRDGDRRAEMTDSCDVEGGGGRLGKAQDRRIVWRDRGGSPDPGGDREDCRRCGDNPGRDLRERLCARTIGGGRGRRLLEIQILERQPHVSRISRSTIGLLLQAAIEQSAEGGSHGRWQLIPIRMAFQDPGNDLGRGVAGEGTSSGDHFVKDTAEGPDVGPAVHRLSPRLLGAQVGGRPENGPFPRHTCGNGRGLGKVRVARSRAPFLGEPKIEDLDRAVGRDSDVARLQVAVNDALGVRRLQALGDLVGDLNRVLDRDRSSLDSLREVFAFDQFHDEEDLARIDRLQPEQRRDVRVIHTRQDLRLTLEASESLGVVSKSFRQDLDGHVPLEAGVLGAVYLTHAARTEGLGDHIVTELVTGFRCHDQTPSFASPIKYGNSCLESATRMGRPGPTFLPRVGVQRSSSQAMVSNHKGWETGLK